MKKTLTYIIVLLVGAVIGWLCRPKHIERVVDIQRDTITKIDTHVVEKPVLKEKRVTDTVFVAIEVHDTTTINDTLYMRLEFETKTYQGEDYLAKVSGYNPSLYYIETYPKTKVIKESVTQSVTNRNTLGVGIEVGYMTALSVPIYLEYGRMLNDNIEVYGRVMRDIRLDMTGASIGTRIQFGW